MTDRNAFEHVGFDICAEILQIMETYDEPVWRDGHPAAPGGLEHMGDVWRLLGKWQRRLLEARKITEG